MSFFSRKLLFTSLGVLPLIVLGALDAHAVSFVGGAGLGGVVSGSGGISVGSGGVTGGGVISIGGITIGIGNGGIAIGGGGCGGGTIGGVICDMDFAWQWVPGLFAGISYMLGIYFGVLAILKLRDHVETPNNTPLSDSMKRGVAAGCFLALPVILRTVETTLTAGNWFGNVETGFSGQSTGTGLDHMVVALMGDIWTPFANLLTGFSYLAGIVLVMIGISRLIKSSQEGVRGPSGIGTIATFLLGGALFSVDSMLGATGGSLFDTNDITTFPQLAFTAGMSGQEVAHVNAVISAVEAFMMVLGWVAFIRGLFIVRGVAEGDQQASLMAGLTHIFGGALAVNLGPVINAVQATFGLQQYGVNFV